MNRNDAHQQTQAKPAGDYESAVSRFRHRAEEEAKITASGGASHLLQHGGKTARAYILLHGTTSSPYQWLEFGRILHELGHNVFIPRMPYHGLRSGQVTELAALTADDLRSFAGDVLDTGAGFGDEAVLIGASGGATVAAWTAVQHAQAAHTLLLAPFFGFYALPNSVSRLIMNLSDRLPNFTLQRRGEPQRFWSYRGQSTRGVSAFFALANDVCSQAKQGSAPRSEMIVVTTSRDRLANNDTTARLAAQWRRAGTRVTAFDFAPEFDIPHNSIDPTSAAPIRRQIHQKMLVLLGERA